MKYLDWNDINELAVKQSGKYAVYISNTLDMGYAEDVKVHERVLDNLKCLCTDNTKEYYDYVGWVIAGGLALFETREQAEKVFEALTYEVQDGTGFYVAMYNPDGFVTDN